MDNSSSDDEARNVPDNPIFDCSDSRAEVDEDMTEAGLTIPRKLTVGKFVTDIARPTEALIPSKRKYCRVSVNNF